MPTPIRNRSATALLLVLLVSVSGCAWQRIPPAPDYAQQSTLPLRVGIVLGDTRASAYDGPAVVDLWKDMRLFDSITYPYRDGDPVDAVARLTVSGGWKGEGAGAGFLVGLTLGLASPAIGPSMTGIHDVVLSCSCNGSEVAKYSAHVETSVMWGMAADHHEVARKAEDVQQKKMAGELAQKINADRLSLLKACGK